MTESRLDAVLWHDTEVHCSTLTHYIQLYATKELQQSLPEEATDDDD